MKEQRLRPIIVAPTAVEFGAVKRALREAEARGDVVLAQCGMGVRQAGGFCERILPEHVSCVALVGWAGGLAQNLAVGDLVSADTAVMEGCPRLEIRALDLSGARRGAVLTAPKALASAADKRSAGEVWGAIAVEMEAYPLAAWAERQGIPFYHVRIIMDTWDEELPDLEAGGSAWGKARRLPSLAPRLWWMFRRVRSLHAGLARLAVQVARAIG
jgi:nucleoside phosphorylase